MAYRDRAARRVFHAVLAIAHAPFLPHAERRRAVDDYAMAGVDWTAQNTRHQEDQRAMNEGQYYVGKGRVDFGELLSSEVVANIEELADVNGIMLAPGMTWYELMREYPVPIATAGSAVTPMEHSP